jgi:hypothetical protein
VVEAIISPSPTPTAERRADCRYPIHTGIEYKLILGQRAIGSGSGRLLNISRGGLLFECDRAIAPKTRIEVDIDWPARTVKVVLHVGGQTVRSEGLCTAVKILRSAFRAQGETKRTRSNVSLLS